MIPTEEEILKEAYGEYGSGPAIGGFCRGADYMLERLRPYLIEWVSVEDERKPEDREDLLLACGGQSSQTGFWSATYSSFCTFTDYHIPHVSHWARIPLPRPNDK